MIIINDNLYIKIPISDRVIGVLNDNNFITKKFQFPRIIFDKDISGYDFSIKFHPINPRQADYFDDNIFKEITEDSVILTWTVTSLDTRDSGNLFFSIKGILNEVEIFSTHKAYFKVAAGINAEQHGITIPQTAVEKTLKDAKQYTDEELAAILPVISSEIDSKDSAILNNANSYTNSAISDFNILNNSNLELKADKQYTYTKDEVADIISNLIASIDGSENVPQLLDTFYEIANALGNDPNFAASVMSSLGGKADKENTYNKTDIDNQSLGKLNIDQTIPQTLIGNFKFPKITVTELVPIASKIKVSLEAIVVIGYSAGFIGVQQDIVNSILPSPFTGNYNIVITSAAVEALIGREYTISSTLNGVGPFSGYDHIITTIQPEGLVAGDTFDIYSINMANVDFGTGIVTGSSFISNTPYGTAPLTVNSPTKVTNLNADLWDGYHFSDYINQSIKTTSSVSFASLALSGAITLNNLTGSSTGRILGLNLSKQIVASSYDMPNQSLLTTSSPTFSALILSGLTASKMVGTNASKQLVSSSYNIPNQDLQTTSTPTFGNIIDSGLVANKMIGTNASKQLISYSYNVPDQDLSTIADVNFSSLTLGILAVDEILLSIYNYESNKFLFMTSEGYLSSSLYSMPNQNLSTASDVTFKSVSATSLTVNTANIRDIYGNTLIGTNPAGIVSGAVANLMIGLGTGNNCTTGRDNLFFAAYAGYDILDGYQNVGLGSYSLNHNKHGNDNLGIGKNALYNLTSLNNSTSPCNNNVAIGSLSGMNLVQGSNNTFINFMGPSGNYSNKMFIGDNAGSPVIYADAGKVGIGTQTPSVALEIGSKTAGQNQIVNATEGSELAPALIAGNWTGTDGWSVSNNTLVRVAGVGSGTISPTAASPIVAGKVYKLTYTVASKTGFNYASVGSVIGLEGIAVGVYTHYITANSTGKLTFICPVSTYTMTISQVSLKELIPNTGTVTVDGRLILNSGIYSSNGIQAIDINSSLGTIGMAGAKASTSGYGLVVNSNIMTPNLIYATGFSYGSTSYLYLSEAANTASVRNATNQQNFRVYNKYTDTNNYERLVLTGVQGTSVNIKAESAGTGSANLDIVLTPKGTGKTVAIGTFDATKVYTNEVESLKFKITPEGGYAIKLINNTGLISVKGTVAKVGEVDNSFTTNQIDGDMPIGIVYESGIADGLECWIVVSGIADVLLVNTASSTRSYIAYSSGTVAGRIDTASSAPAATLHFREIGHTLENKTSGTDILCKCVLHFN